MFKKIVDFVKLDTVKNVSVLSLGTLVAQLIPFLFSPLIARLYSPEDFGLFAIVLGGINIVAVVVNGRYDLSVVLPKTIRKASDLVVGSALIGVLVSIVAIIAVYLGRDLLADVLTFELTILEGILLMIILTSIAISQPLNYFLLRSKAYKNIALNKLVKGSVLVFSSIGLGYYSMSFSLNGLILGFGCSWIALAVFSSYQSIKAGFIYKGASFSSIKVVLSEYKEYPLYNALPALFNSIATQMGIYIFMFHFDQSQTGYYTISKQYVFVPMSILSMSLSQVIFQRLSEKYNQRASVIQELKILVSILIGIAVVIVLVLNLFSAELFTLFFGEQWLPSAVMVKTLVFYFAVQFIVSPLTSVLHALKRVKLAALFPILYLICMFSLFFIPITNLDSFLKIYTGMEIIPYLFSFSIICWAIVSYENELKKSMSQ